MAEEEQSNNMVDEDEPLEDDEPLEVDDEPLEEDEEQPVPFPIKNYTKSSLSALFAPSMNPEMDPPVVESLEFHREGRLLVSVDSNSDLLQIDAVKGEVIKKFSYKKYPIGLCRYTHHSQAVLCSSRKMNTHEKNRSVDTSEAHDIRYLSLYDNTYQRFFHGHTDEVVSLAMNPSDDSFASASKDQTVRFWNLKSSKCNAVLTIPSNSSPPYVAYDPTGKVIAVTYSTSSANVVKLFDAHNYATGPFATFSLEHSDIAKFVSKTLTPQVESLSRCEWTNILFSPDESYILVSSKGKGLVFILDAFDGNLLRCFSSHQDSISSSEASLSILDEADCCFGSACFTPDGAYVIAGTDSGKICFWSMSQDEAAKAQGDGTIEMPSVVLEADHPSLVRCLACSPTYGVIASSCSVVALWVDSEQHQQDV